MARFAVNQAQSLSPDMSSKEIMGLFDRTESDELAVVDDKGQVLGTVSEAYATRRYAEELEKQRAAIIAAKLQACDALFDETEEHWQHISNRK